MDYQSIPSNWSEVTVDEFINIHSIKNDEPSLFSKQLSILSVLMDADEEEFYDLDVDELSKIYKNITWIHRQPKCELKDSLVIGNGLYYLIDLNKLTLGEYIDIDTFVTNDYYKNIKLLASILYRKKKIGEWVNEIWEPYGVVDIFKRSEEFNQLPITSIFGILQYILNWRDNFVKTYQVIFNPVIPDDEMDDVTELSPEELEEEQKERELEKFSWALLVDKLTNGDITKMDEVTDLPVIQVFNHLILDKVKK